MEKSKAHGVLVVQQAVQQMPSLPGIYKMIDAQGVLLYVGKAKNLFSRVRHYTNLSGLPMRLQRMIAQVAKVEVTTTRNEAEALLMEAGLVRAEQPRYNILLKDDKSFPYIRLTAHEFPRIERYRGNRKEPGSYYGPFVSGSSVYETMSLLQRAFLVRPCSDAVFAHRTRPCLQYQIKRCSAPCVNKVSREDYAGLVGEAKAFLEGKSRQLQDALTRQMQEASASQHFEEAARLRDRIRALTQVQHQHGIIPGIIGDADVMVLVREGGVVCVEVACFRAGQHFGVHSFFPTHAAEATESEIFTAFIGQFYQTQMPPKQVLLSHIVEESTVLEEALALRAGAKVEVHTPIKGEKKKLIDHGLTNAQQSLKRHLAERGTQRELLEEVAKLFGLEEPPERIEIYDNSHLMGTMAVGAMVVATPQGFDKKSYRRFGMKREETVPGDDYAMMREMLTRRFVKLQEAEAEGLAAIRPDLLLIDGGAGHMRAVQELMEQLGVSVPFVCIAKGVDRNAGREWLHQPGKPAFQLPEGAPALHYLQRLRDEAHRFAISFHRHKRGKALRASELDTIPAVGMRRKQALLMHFGSARALSVASVEDLMKVQGINKATAEKIWRHYHG